MEKITYLLMALAPISVWGLAFIIFKKNSKIQLKSLMVLIAIFITGIYLFILYLMLHYV
jgi:hypothetical protein